MIGPGLLLSLALALPSSAAEAPASAAPQEAPTPLLDELIKGGLTPEQRAGLGEQASLEDAATLMSPEQRAAARARLADAEGRAKTAAELKEIARGYLILDLKSPTAGQAARVAAQIVEKEPESSEGHALAAAALHQQGDYAGAVEQAKTALKLNPADKAALAALKLSQDRVPKQVALPAGQVEKSLTAGQTSARADDAKLPYKLPIKSRPMKPVPNVSFDPPTGSDDGSKSGSSPLLPLAGASALLTAYGVHRKNRTWNENDFEKAPEESDEEAAKAGRTWTRERALRHARAAGVGLAAGLSFYYGGPIIAGAVAAAPNAYRAASNGLASANNSLQRVMASRTGAVMPATPAVGFARGTAQAALSDPARVQHAADHFIKQGLFPAWNKQTETAFRSWATHVLENPRQTFDYVMKRGREPVKGFVGYVQGRPAVVFVYKAGKNQGQIATAITPSAEQMTAWGIR